MINYDKPSLTNSLLKILFYFPNHQLLVI